MKIKILSIKFFCHYYDCFSALQTEDKLEYQFFPSRGNQVQFRVKAANDAHIALTPGPQEGEPMFEV